MKSNLLQEMYQILEREELLNVTIPMPSYLFVQKYGRNIEEDMDEITELLGMKEWFSFNTNQQKEKSILAKFLIEQECQASLGKEYTGCVLVELSGDEDEKEMREFLDYVNDQKQRIICVYTTKAIDRVSELRKQLTQHSFVRAIHGECYDAYEQLELFERTLESFQFSLEESAKSTVTEFFRTKEWQETDAVKIQIQNMVKSLVYGKMLDAKSKDATINKEEIENALSDLEVEPVRKRQIGFVQEA